LLLLNVISSWTQWKKPNDWNLFFDDLQILGKPEIQSLIIWRNKIRSKLFKHLKEETDESTHKEETLDEIKMKEIDEEIKKMQKLKKHRLENEKKKQEKNELRQKISFINNADNQDEDNKGVEFDASLYEDIRKRNIDIEKLAEDNLQESEEESEDQNEEQDIELSDLSENDYYEMMNDDIEQNDALYEEEKNLVTGKKNKKTQKKSKKEDFEVEERQDQDLDMDDEDGEDEGDSEFDSDSNSDDIDDDKDDEDIEEAMEIDDHQHIKKRKKQVKFDEDLERDSILSDDKGEDLFENPLKSKSNLFKSEIKKPSDQNEEENESYDSNPEEEAIGKKRKRKDSGKKEDLEEVEKVNSESEYDTDEKAEIRAIAKKMLRKKERNRILNGSYNRYAFDDITNAPQWFADEENLYNRPNKPVTKEEIDLEKEELMKFNARVPRKVLEAKARKKKLLSRKLDKIKKQANYIVNQEEINEKVKVRHIEKLYKKEMNKNKKKTKYVVTTNKNGFSKSKGKGKNVKYVDKRMKKDAQAKKRRDKKKYR